MLSLVAITAALAEPPAPPALKPCTILQPTYTIDGKNASFGTMFAVAVGGQSVLVTAHDLFSPNGGLPAQLSPAEVVSKVTALTAKDALAPTVTCARSNKALEVKDAAPMGGDAGASRDVAVFSVLVDTSISRLQAVEQVPLAPLSFAARAPKVGETVWLASPVDGQKGSMWQAKVVEISPNFLFFEYANRDLVLNGTTGAPILDSSGAVVGLNVGFGKMDDGALIGSAAPYAALKQRVEAAAAQK